MMKKLLSLLILCLVANAISAQLVTKAEDLFTPKDLFILGKKMLGTTL
ncbi:MAG: hypothetical protein M0D57_03295 [Sphingobacteriales bacterium JAD_PAG50586_3]|nr:MAG: hypothetical protein M0D57_03295 [Sphingobacteriales bacterium JAD_PAG50586_3]